MYDPIQGRMLSPDNYVANVFGTQGYNRFSYANNNPLVYVDPDGNFPWLIVAIGAVIGAYSGGTIANNGQFNPIKWDWSSGKTWGYMLGGAVVGAGSAYLGATVAATGAAFSNTGALVIGSFSNSLGMAVVTGGQTSVGVNFGIASFDFDSEEAGYIGKKGNRLMGNFGYALGTLTNLSDYVDYKASLKAVDRIKGISPTVNPSEYNKDGWYGKYLGPSGNANPIDRLASGVIPIDKLDWQAFYHDVFYYDSGADGITGALFSKSVMSADLKLARGAREVLHSANAVSKLTTRYAIGTNYAFTALYGFKTALSYSYLYPIMPRK